MNNVMVLMTIGERAKSEQYLEYFKKKGISLSLGTFGRGTANREMIEMIGIGDSERCVIFSFVTAPKARMILKRMRLKLFQKKFGRGISFSIPFSSIDCKKSLMTLVGDVSNEEGEGYCVETENELIVVIANRGYTEAVMKVAREAGAPGGTVVHARGTGQESSEKFFGTIIGAEKEMIFIVTKTEKRTAIMKAIRDKAGADTQSGAVVFSLPVNEIAGMT